MSKAKDFLKRVELEEMAFKRDKWIEDTCNQLRGAMKEFTKLYMARVLKTPDYWSHEIHRLVSKVREQFDVNKVKTKTDFNLLTAFKEAVNDAKVAQDRVSKAKSEMSNHYPDEFKKIAMMRLDSKEMLVYMLKEFMPDYFEEVAPLFKSSIW